MSDTLLLEYHGQFGRGRTLDSIVNLVDSLPPLPDVAACALRLLDDPGTTPGDLAAVLGRDPALVSTTLRAANSAALGMSETVSDLAQAIMIVGLSALKSRLLAVTLKNWNRNFGASERLVWEKSLGAAVAAEVLATHLGKTCQKEAHLCGLLHNLGQIVMLSLPDVRRDYPAVVRYIGDHQVDFAEAERNVIGFSYPLVGALVARRWQLPYSTCVCILRHNDPLERIESKLDEQVALTKLAAATGLGAGLGCPHRHPLFGSALVDLAVALGFDRQTFGTDKEVLIRQARALYATEASVYTK